MADTKLSALNTRGTPDRAADQIYVINGGAEYRSTINNELGITGNPVGHTDTQTLTNKTLTAPTISSPVLSGTVTGTYTLGGTPTFPASVATLTGIQTLTNKTLTSPTINSPTITNASISADAITGFSTSNTGTIYGLAITSGTLSGVSLTDNTVTGAKLTGTYKLNTQAFTTNTTQTAAIIKEGWTYVNPGSGTATTVAVTFPTAFPNSVVQIQHGILGARTAGVPAVVTDFNVGISGENLNTSISTAATVTGVTLQVYKSSAFSSTSTYYGVWWRAVGT